MFGRSFSCVERRFRISPQNLSQLTEYAVKPNIRNFLLLKMFLEWTINYEVPRKNLVDIWHKLFTSVADSRAPVKTLCVRGFSTPWMNPSISAAMRDRADYHHKQARSSKSGIRFANSVTLCVVRLTKQNPSFIPN